MQTKGKKGFTLLEVLVVVLIAVLVTLFAVPAYKKSQDKNRYLAASGVLMDLANAVRMTLEEYPNVSVVSRNLTGIGTVDNEASAKSPTEGDESNIIYWMFTQGYFNNFPLTNSAYMGYSYAVSTTGKANCGSSCAKTNAIACMSGNNANTQFTCAWVDKSGILHHN